MKTLVDSSVWINFFITEDNVLRFLIEENNAVTTGVVLLEIIPFLHRKNLRSLEQDVLDGIPKVPLEITDGHWEHLISLQKILIGKGMNGISIPDLMMLFCCQVHNIQFYTHDKTLIKAAEALGVAVFKI